MTSKTLTFTAQIEYDPTSTTVEQAGTALHTLMLDGLESADGTLALDFSEVDDGEAGVGEKPPRLFDEAGDGWTSYGKEIGRRVGQAVKSIADDCLADGVDLRHAAFIAQQEVSTQFLRVFAQRRFRPKDGS